MQDDPENRRNRVGNPQGNANQNAECRESDTFTNQRILEGQCGDRVPWAKPRGGVRLGREDAGESGVSSAAKETARRDPGLPEQGRRAEPAADRAADSGACPDRESGSEGISTAALRCQVQGCRHCAAGASGRRARALERAGHAMHLETRVFRVRQSEVRPPGRDLRGASLQLTEERGVPESGCGVPADAAEPGLDRRAAAARSAGRAGLPASGYGAPGGLGWRERRVSHQRRGR